MYLQRLVSMVECLRTERVDNDDAISNSIRKQSQRYAPVPPRHVDELDRLCPAPQRCIRLDIETSGTEPSVSSLLLEGQLGTVAAACLADAFHKLD